MSPKQSVRCLTLAGLSLLAVAAIPFPGAGTLFGIGAHILPGFATVSAGDDITVQNDGDTAVDVTIVRRDTNATLHSASVKAGDTDSWTVADSLVGKSLRTTVVEPSTKTVVAQRDHRVVR